MYKLIIDAAVSEKRLALLNGSKLELLSIIKPGQQSLAGNIYLGTVEKVLPGMNAVFVNIGTGKNGYLPKEKLAAFVRSQESLERKRSMATGKFVRQGEKMLVQVEKDASGSKGPRLTGIVGLQGKFTVYQPYGNTVSVSKKIRDDKTKTFLRELGHSLKEEGESLIFRTESQEADEGRVVAELGELRSAYQELVRKSAELRKPGPLLEADPLLNEATGGLAKLSQCDIIVNDLPFKRKLEAAIMNTHASFNLQLYSSLKGIFAAFQLEAEVEHALNPVVWLESGAYLVFDETEALTVIDVNTGRFSGKEDLKETAEKTNLHAAKEIVRQIMIRDLSGIILIDFIDMNEAGRDKVANEMKQALRRDSRQTKVVGFTPLGILQLTRAKAKPSLSELVTEPCSVCQGEGRVRSAESTAASLERELREYRYSDHEAVLVAATKDIIRLFTGESAERKHSLEADLGFTVFFTINDFPKPYYDIVEFGRKELIARKAVI